MKILPLTNIEPVAITVMSEPYNLTIMPMTIHRPLTVTIFKPAIVTVLSKDCYNDSLRATTAP